MSLLRVPAGASAQQAREHMRGVGWWLPRRLSDGAVLASSSRPLITATGSATPHTAGSWVEVVSALTEAVCAVRVTVPSTTATSGTNSSTFLSLGVGGAGSETEVVPYLPVGYRNGNQLRLTPDCTIPLYIPKGSRVAARVQSAQASKAVQFRVEFFALDGGPVPSSSVVAINADTANSRGTVITVPGSTNTKGAWTELASATTEPFAALAIGIQAAGSTSLGGTSGLLDIGGGAAGSEQVLIPDLEFYVDSTEWITLGAEGFYGVSLPKGSRLVARYARASSSSTPLDVLAHGIRPPA